MDDLDHCVHIAECDWHSFYEETEECCLLQPALAVQDDSSLSDSEDPGRPAGSVPDTDQHEPKQSSGPNAEGLREAEQGFSSYTLLPLQTCQSGLGDTSQESNGQSGIEKDQSWENIIPELIMGKSAEQDTEVKNDHTFIKQCVVAKPVNDECSASESTHVQHTEIKMNLEPLGCPDGTAQERYHCDARRVEKERWFVTLNDSPIRLRPNAGTLVKKKKQKKKRRSSLHRASMSESQDSSNDSGPEIETDGINYSEGKDITQLNHNSKPESSSSIFLEYSNPTHVSDFPQMTIISSPPLGNGLSLELPLETNNSSKALTVESFTDSEKGEKNSSAVSSENTVAHGAPTTHGGMDFTQRNEDTPKMDGIASEHLKDHTEFFSSFSYDSEDYISATESTEEPQKYAQCNISQMSSSSSLLITETNLQPPAGEDCLRCALPQQGEGYESTADQAYIEPAKTFARSGDSDHMTPENSSLSSIMMAEHRDNHHLTDNNIARSPPVPVITVTPFSVTEGPETFTDALDPSRPVYAISSFWDEMEKLTIKDILQLRSKGRSPSPSREAPTLQAIARAQVDGDMENSSFADKADYVLPNGNLMDTSDTADSDYFTHIDDFKPDRSSCEFSTFSDFDEEYYFQFLGASINPSPEPQDLKRQSEISIESPFLRGSLQEEVIGPVGQADPVDVQQLTVQDSEDCIQNMILSDDNTFPRRLTKNRSLHNVNAFGTEMQLRDVSLNSTLEAERTLILSTHQALEDNPLLGVNSRITPRTRTPTPVITNTYILDERYHISFPEVFEHFFGDDEPKDNSQSLLSVYESQSISVPDQYNYSLPKYEAGMLLSTLQGPQCSEEPVAIFSCSRAAARDLTFPELEDLLFPHDTYAQSEEEEEDNSSPIRVVTRNDIQAKLATSSLASDGNRRLFIRKSWRGDWRSLLSLRRIRLPGKGSSWCRRSGAWIFPPVPQRNLEPLEMNQAIETINETRTTSLPTALSPRHVIQFGQLFFRELAEQQRRFIAMQTTISVAGKDDLFTQSDMCLVCIAFAAWVLRSTDSQRADAWKAALLANVSAISAIQYLRRCMRRQPATEEDL